MKVLNLSRSNNISFGREPDAKTEVPWCKKAMKEAQKFIGNDVALISHTSCRPIKDRDLFIGINTGKAEKDFQDFLALHGFNVLQDGPHGLTHHSPYNSSVFSKNYTAVDMDELTTSKYANILDFKDIEEFTSHDYEASKMGRTNFERAFNAYDNLFLKAYDNLNTKASNKDKDAIKLMEKFDSYKKNSGKWLHTDALFELFYAKYRTKNFEKWSDLDNNLMVYVNDATHPKHEEAVQYLKMAESTKSKAIDVYKFKQFVKDKQDLDFIAENPERLKKKSDAIIGFSPRDEWANRNAFLKDYRIGAPDGGPGFRDWNCGQRGSNQLWGLPVLDPKKLFNEDGSLGPAGQLIHDKFARLLESGGTRVDNAFSYIDPWIYNVNNISVVRDVNGKITWNDACISPLSERGKQGIYNGHQNWDYGYRQVVENSPNLDPDGNYPKILEKIILPLIEEKGLKPEDLVWEDLGWGSNKFYEVYNHKLNLPHSIFLTGQQGQHAGNKNWYFLDNHDMLPASNVLTKEFYESNSAYGRSMYPEYLTGLIHPEKTLEQRNEIAYKLYADSNVRISTKVSEMIRSGNSQMTYETFAGDFIEGNDIPYNQPGTNLPENWTRRLTKNYKEIFYERLANPDGKHVALNMPEIFERVIVSKIYTTAKSAEEKIKLLKDTKNLRANLLKFAEILKEPISNIK